MGPILTAPEPTRGSQVCVFGHASLFTSVLYTHVGHRWMSLTRIIPNLGPAENVDLRIMRMSFSLNYGLLVRIFCRFTGKMRCGWILNNS